MKASKKFTNLFTQRNLILFGVILLILKVLFLSIYEALNHDELEAIHSGWKISNGEIIYKDFFQHHHSLLYKLISLIFDFNEIKIEILTYLRFIYFCLFLITLTIVFKISKLFHDNPVFSYLTLFFLLSISFFSDVVFQVRPDTPQVLFSLLAIYFFLKWHNKDSSLYLMISALSLAIGFIFLQKAIFTVFAIFVASIYRLIKNKTTLKSFFLYWVLFGSFIFLFLIEKWVSNSIDEYYFYNWALNLNFLREFSILGKLRITFIDNAPLWVLFFVSFFYTRNSREKELFILSFISLFLLFLVKTPYEQYFLLFFSLFSVLVTIPLRSLASLKFIKVVIVLYGMFALNNNFYKLYSYESNEQQFEKIAFVIENTNKDDFVYDGNITFNVFRKDLDFFWYSVRPRNGALESYKAIKPYEYDIYKKIRTLKPKIISNNYLDTSSEVITNDYTYHPKFKDILIRNND